MFGHGANQCTRGKVTRTITQRVLGVISKHIEPYPVMRQQQQQQQQQQHGVP